MTTILRDLGDGLIVRQATLADTETLIALSSVAFAPFVGAMVGRVVRGERPIGSIDDFIVVEDTTTGEVVSSLSLLALPASYGGIPLTIGQVEWVVTQPAYRRRGLILRQFDIVHARSAERGDLLQVIQGIPYYYRQYGYDYAIDHFVAQTGSFADIPTLADVTTEPYLVRDATSADAPFIAAIFAQAQRRYLIARDKDTHYWANLIIHMQPEDTTIARIVVITLPDGTPIGFARHSARINEHGISIFDYEILPQFSWFAVTPSILRYVQAFAIQTEGSDVAKYTLPLGAGHPAYAVNRSYAQMNAISEAWYVRIPDVPRLLNHIAPVLEERLAQSPLVGYTGMLKISFYTSGVRLEFSEGRIAANAWQPEYGIGSPFSHLPADGSQAAFPNQSFTQLVCGYRSLAELEDTYIDCRHEDDLSKALLDTLFPKHISYITM